MENTPSTPQPTALITGASSGIGYELSQLFAQHGYSLVLVARNTARLAEVAKELAVKYQSNVVILAKDLAQPASAAELAAEVQKRKIQIDVLVNNAGFGSLETFAEAEWEPERQMMQLNMLSLVELTRFFLPGMVQRKFGKILNVGSTGSFSPVPYMAIYGASKAFVLSFSEALSGELKRSGVSVTALCPGVTLTNFHERAHSKNTLLMRLNQMSAASVAKIGFKAMLRGKTCVVPGLFNKLTIWSMRLASRNSIIAMGKILIK